MTKPVKDEKSQILIRIVSLKEEFDKDESIYQSLAILKSERFFYLFRVRFI